ncbi:MAG: formate dehydrogenase subunit alpha [Candidatus Brocadia sp.]
MEQIDLIIDGKQISVKKGTSIIEAAKMLGIKIPTLCYHPELTPTGLCRICVVEVEGEKTLQASCMMPAKDGMIVNTSTDRVLKVRKRILQNIIKRHKGNCSTCRQFEFCQLRAMSRKLDLGEIWFNDDVDIPSTALEGPIVREMHKCIACGKCVRVCAEVQGVGVLELDHPIIKRYKSHSPLPDVGLHCENCGQCALVCPTGAIVEKNRQPHQKRIRTVCNYCGTGCRYYADVDKKNDRIVCVTSDLEDPISNGQLCTKGRFGYEFIRHPDRLTKPLIRRNGVLVESSWEEAIQLVAARFEEIKENYGPDAIGGIGSARIMNEENYVFQKFMRAVIGTNNIDCCARVCHAPSVAGLSMTLGSGAASSSYADIGQAELIMIVGSNTTEAHPGIGLKVKQAVRKGAKLIVVEPRRIPITRYAHYWLQIKPGTNIALFNAFANYIIKNDLTDKKFVKNRTEGFEEFKVLMEKYTPKYVEDITGVSKDIIREAARLYATHRSIILYGLGVTEHQYGTKSVMSLANLGLLTGNFGKPGTGVNPLRGQNNVQGACDMGNLPNLYTGYQPVENPEVRLKFEKAWGVPLSSKTGLRSPDMIKGALEGTIKALYLIGDDPVQIHANATLVRRAFEKVDFLVAQDIFLTETGKYAHVVLPAACFMEKTGCFSNAERRMQLCQKALEPIGESKADWEIISLLARTMGYGMHYNSSSEIFDEIAQVAPIFAGINHRRLKGSDGLQWPCYHEDHPGISLMFEEKFPHPNGLAKFIGNDYLQPDEWPDQEYPLILITGRHLEHFNNGAQTRRCTALVAARPEELLEMHPEDTRPLGLKNGDYVIISSRRGSVRVKVRVTRSQQRGTAFMSIHFHEIPANVLTGAPADDITGTYNYKVTAVKVNKAWPEQVGA